MTSDGQVYFELLPIEINKPKLTSVFKAQFKKGITLAQIIPAIEIEHLAKIKESVSKILKNQIGDLETEYLNAKSTIEEMLKWLEYLVESRKAHQDINILPENEKEVLEKVQLELISLGEQLAPTVQTLLRKREKDCLDLKTSFLKTVDLMEEETKKRSKKIILEYEKLGQEKYEQVLLTFQKFFSKLRSQSETLILFIQPRISQWNAQVLKTGRGLYIQRTGDLPCSILFSLKGQCHLIFENVGQLLGSGLDKLVLRTFSLPQGKIEALIKPLFAEAKEDDPEFEKRQRIIKRRFQDIWLETELLMRLKNKRGIVSIQDRMAFEIDKKLTLFLVEDFYWDGNLWNYLKYPLYLKIPSSRFSPETQKQILTDLLTGLKEIHLQGIVHHDIKLDNILLDMEKKESKAVIADFQLATYLNDEARIASLRFVPKWTPPEFATIHDRLKLSMTEDTAELIKQYKAVTIDKMDVWGLGLVFYSLVTYQLPFWVAEQMEDYDDDSSIPFESMVNYEKIDMMKLFHLIANLKKGWLPDEVKTSPYFPLLEKMLEPDPQDRCSAEEALKILEKIQI